VRENVQVSFFLFFETPIFSIYFSRSVTKPIFSTGNDFPFEIFLLFVLENLFQAFSGQMGGFMEKGGFMEML
jgi:hypothetical protein